MTNPSDTQPRIVGRFDFNIPSPHELDPFSANPEPMANFTEEVPLLSTTTYMNEHGFHRTNGFAVESDDYTGLYFINGEPVGTPDGTTDFNLTNVDADGTQHWTSAGGGRTAIVRANGTTIFYQDYDVHREGGPAVVNADSTEAWFSNGTQIPNPWPAAPTLSEDTRADTKTAEGSRYVEGRPVKEIAAALKADIALALRAGTLDRLGLTYTVSVNPNRREDRPTVNVVVSGMPRWRIVREGEPSDQPFHSDEVLVINRALERLGQAYNKTTVHNGTDSIQSPFWFNTTITNAK